MKIGNVDSFRYDRMSMDQDVPYATESAPYIDHHLTRDHKIKNKNKREQSIYQLSCHYL